MAGRLATPSIPLETSDLDWRTPYCPSQVRAVRLGLCHCTDTGPADRRRTGRTLPPSGRPIDMSCIMPRLQEVSESLLRHSPQAKKHPGRQFTELNRILSATWGARTRDPSRDGKPPVTQIHYLFVSGYERQLPPLISASSIKRILSDPNLPSVRLLVGWSVACL